jgi:hypothetical protein
MQVGFAGLLTIVFIVLKLTGVIAWSWLWVLAPIWIGFILWIALILLVLWANTAPTRKNKK